MTPDEARQTWCPHARVALLTADGEVVIPSYNRIVTISDGLHGQLELPNGSCCVADRCAEWRWSWSPKQADKHKKDNPAYPISNQPYGYCGLAGAHGNG